MNFMNVRGNMMINLGVRYQSASIFQIMFSISYLFSRGWMIFLWVPWRDQRPSNRVECVDVPSIALLSFLYFLIILSIRCKCLILTKVIGSINNIVESFRKLFEATESFALFESIGIMMFRFSQVEASLILVKLWIWMLAIWARILDEPAQVWRK